MMPQVSASLANSSGVTSSSPFNVQSGGGKQTIVLIVALAAVAIIGLLVLLKK